MSYYVFKPCVQLNTEPKATQFECLLLVPTPNGWNCTYYEDDAKLNDCPPALGAPGTTVMTATRVH